MNGQIKIKMRINQLLILTFVLLAGVLLIGLVQTSAAQIIKPKTAPQVKPTPPAVQKKIVFRSKGVNLPPAESQAGLKQRNPQFLAEAQRRLSGVMAENGDTNNAAVTSYLTLSPRASYVENKGFLQLFNARALRPSSNFADFWIAHDLAANALSSGVVEVWIKPAHAGQWLLADCTVWNHSGTFKVEQTGGNNWQYSSREKDIWRCLLTPRTPTGIGSVSAV